METININKASAKELEKIIHIGPVRAAMIIAKRPFKDVYEISKIDRIGEKRTEDIVREGRVVV